MVQKFWMALIPVFLTLNGCSDAYNAVDALHAAGMKHIKIGDYTSLECRKNYDLTTKFEAENSNGERVSGVYCSGLFSVSREIHYDAPRKASTPPLSRNY